MRMRSGQVAVYLVLVLVAITFLVLMNVGTFLGVSARNTTMNGGDAAALAVARYQGELLNRIGELNRRHLEAALRNDTNACAEAAAEQLRLCFLGPLENRLEEPGRLPGNTSAQENACDENDEMREILRQHVIDIRMEYATNPDLYPEPWPGAWEEYAANLESVIQGDFRVGPDNIDFVDAATGHLLLTRGFYEAIAGRSWCWFRFHAPGILDTYGSFRDWGPLPAADDETRRRKCVNSEIYSLNLDLRVGSAVDLLGVELLRRLTDATEDEIRSSPLLHDRTQKWFFFDETVWRKWWELDPSGERQFPAMGRVRAEYDVRGCAAICRVTKTYLNVVSEDEERESVWSAAAKPFGTVENENGERDVVTACRGLVLPAFTDVRLVPLDGVGGEDLSTADPQWMKHVREHLGGYLENGPGGCPDCFYCQQLHVWEHPLFRAEGSGWLKLNSQSCIRPVPGPGGRGGSAHGH